MLAREVQFRKAQFPMIFIDLLQVMRVKEEQASKA